MKPRGHLGMALEARMKGVGLSAVGLARRSCTARSTLQEAMAGRSIPTTTTLAAWAVVLECEVGPLAAAAAADLSPVTT